MPGVYERQFDCAYGVAHRLPPPEDDPPELDELDEEPDEDPVAPDDDPDELDEDPDDDPDAPDDDPDDEAGASHGATHFPVDVLHAHSLGHVEPHGPDFTLP